MIYIGEQIIHAIDYAVISKESNLVLNFSSDVVDED